MSMHLQLFGVHLGNTLAKARLYEEAKREKARLATLSRCFKHRDAGEERCTHWPVLLPSQLCELITEGQLAICSVKLVTSGLRLQVVKTIRQCNKVVLQHHSLSSCDGSTGQPAGQQSLHHDTFDAVCLQPCTHSVP